MAYTKWSTARKLNNVTLPEWKWVGTGPPGSIELRNGRILVPSYHSKYRGNLINNIVYVSSLPAHSMISFSTALLRNKQTF